MLTESPYPAHIRDNPVMQGAFASFMDFLWREEGAHAAHCEATGHPPLSRASSPIDAEIDKATGFAESYAESFERWAIETQWGAEGDDAP